MNTKTLGLVAIAMLAMIPVATADSGTATDETSTTADESCNIITQSLLEYLACKGGETVRDACDEIFGSRNCDGTPIN